MLLLVVVALAFAVVVFVVALVAPLLPVKRQTVAGEENPTQKRNVLQISMQCDRNEDDDGGRVRAKKNAKELSRKV